MLRKSTRERKEYLFQKALEDRESATFEKKKRLRDALEQNKALPTELRNKSGDALRRKLDLEDDVTKDQHQVLDDEYAYMGVRDPKIVLTTAREPSSRLMSFVKELRLLMPNAQRINRGSYVMKDLVEMSRKNGVSDIVIVHEHRGEPDGLIISHLPYGPTAYFGMKNVVLRHDLSEKPDNMSEAAPHLCFHNFDSKFGQRVATILKALFPPPAPLGNRVMTFANHRDTIHFRHYNYGDKRGSSNNGEEDGSASSSATKLATKKRKLMNNAVANNNGMREQDVDLREVGPRFSLQLYRVELGTLEMKDAKVEWVLRPYFNKQKDVLADSSSLGGGGAKK
ncbi:unnamed protein product [Amoebophrya sp. A25]|nr:unnamed protein product [Amoebophrya sp. A25]|eukprot:GSA25T00021127001.1